MEQLLSFPNFFEKYQIGKSLYFGQMEGKVRQGLGVMVYTNGRIYEGNWLKDIR